MSAPSPASFPAPEPLDRLPRGVAAVVESVEVEGPLARRLQDLGFLPGTRVVMRRRAPLGDPTVYELRGTQLCLRRAEAACIRVRRVGPGEGASRVGGRR